MLYDLAIVESNLDAAINAFIRRHTGVDALRWLDREGCDQVIRILKAMIRDRLKQKGVKIQWTEFKSFHPARAVLQAQFDLLVAIGALKRSVYVDCEGQAGYVSNINRGFRFYEDPHWQKVQRNWGAWLRRLKQKGKLTW